ncbi:MAG: glycosyltransferase family 4 protein [Bacteroidales bacterium]|nr:glycosyltransferase family 4 protein [Bacteroidales bacterium]
MKILVDCHCFDYPNTEGINTYIRGLYGAMIRTAPKGWEFYLAARSPERLDWAEGCDNVHFVRLSNRGKVRRLLFEYPRIIRRNGIDFAHFQYNAPPLKCLLGHRASEGGRCKTVVTLHDVLFKDFPSFFPLRYRLTKSVLFSLSAWRADMLLTVSEYSRQSIARHFHIPEKKMYVTPNAVTKDFYAIDKRAAREFADARGVGKYLLYVSRFEPRKRQDLLLKTYLEMRLWEQGYDLVFVGRKTLEMPSFDALMEGMLQEVRSHITICYQAPYEELKYWYGAASLFVYPAEAEGFGIPPLEAGAVGIPCICSKRTAMGDFRFFGANHIDCTDEQLLQERIRALLGIGQEAENAHVEEVRMQIANTYDWETIARKFFVPLQSNLKL